MIRRFPILPLAAALAAATAGPSPAASAEARFTAPSELPAVSGDGSIALAWEGAPGAALEYELRRWPGDAPDAGEGVAVYRGPDTATFASGLPAGQHVFRIRAREPGEAFGEWSGGARVEVVFPSGRQALALLAAGAVTLAVTVGSIAVGHRRTRAN